MTAARQMSLAVVGADHPNRKGPTRRFEIAVSLPGEKVQLVHEPKNPADQNAIMVLSERGVCIGYVVADRTTIVHRAWREAHDVIAIFQQKAPFGAWIRIGIDEEPDLPASALKQPAADSGNDGGDGFWADPTYDD